MPGNCPVQQLSETLSRKKGLRQKKNRWFGVSENEGLSTIWKKQIVTAETHDVHGSDLQQPSIVPMPLLIQGVSWPTQLLYESLKVFHFRQSLVANASI